MSDINVGALSESINNKMDRDMGNTTANIDYVVEWKNPSVADPSWYRVYKSGWIEQGGIVTVQANSEYTGVFPKEFADTNITFHATDNSSALNGSTYGFQQGCGASSTTSFFLRSAYDSAVTYSWRAEGIIAQS